MTTLLTEPPEFLQPTTEERMVYVPPRPITFPEFLELFNEKDDVELIDGVVVPRMAAQLDHEKLYGWLFRFIGSYIEETDLGILLGSRTPVLITLFRGRMPDLLFVRKDRMDIVEQKSVNGPPDLIIELVSPNDRPSDFVALEADYYSIGVPEVVFVDQHKQQIRVLRQEAEGESYKENVYGLGETLTFAALDTLTIPTDWLLVEPRPNTRTALQAIEKD